MYRHSEAKRLGRERVRRREREREREKERGSERKIKGDRRTYTMTKIYRVTKRETEKDRKK
jgi:hypothetical protein